MVGTVLWYRLEIQIERNKWKLFRDQIGQEGLKISGEEHIDNSFMNYLTHRIIVFNGRADI
jgi:hypothetical protein